MTLYQDIYDQIMLLEKDSSSETLQKIKNKAEQLEESNRILGLIDSFEKDPSEKNLTTLQMYFERKLQIALKDEDFLKIVSKKKNPNAKSYPLIFVLDNLRSAWNVGSIIRTASAFGAEQVRLYGYSAGLENTKVKKAAMGSEEWLSVKNINVEEIEFLKKDIYKVYGLETDETARTISSFAIEKNAIFILGNERFGISKGLRSLVDHYLYIPMEGAKQSLNVANAAAISSYEYVRQHGIF